MGFRTYTGAGVSTTDNGRGVDPMVVIGILDPRHPLHKRADPQRYSMDNPKFRAFVENIVETGPVPQPAMFRLNGLLKPKDPEYQYLKKTYPKKLEEQPEQPLLELVYGNRRLYGLRKAREIWKETGVDKWDGANLLAVMKKLTLEEMEAEFVLENANRERPSIYEDHLTVRSMLNGNQSWEAIAKRLVMPVKEVRRLHEPLVQAHIGLVQAFSAGSIARAKVMRIVQAVKVEDHIAAMDDDSMLPVKPKAAPKLALSSVPANELRRLSALIRPQGGELGQLAITLEAWLAKLPQTETAESAS